VSTKFYQHFLQEFFLNSIKRNSTKSFNNYLPWYCSKCILFFFKI